MKNVSKQIRKLKRFLAEALNRLRIILKTADTLLSNIRGEWRIPEDAIATIARAILADATAFFATDRGKAEFETWKRQQNGKEESSQSSVSHDKKLA